MPHRRFDSGLTLVELMIALLLSAIVTVQVLAMMSNSTRDYFTQKRMLEGQISGRLIADMAMRDVRAAGFLVPAIVGISSIDGGPANPDALCTSDPAAISEPTVTLVLDRLVGAPLTVSLGSSSTVEVADADKDIDGNGVGDFVVGAGIVVSDGTRTHCARIQALAPGEIQFTPATPVGFNAATPQARAIPAVIYELTGAGLTRNSILISPSVEDFQVEFGVDTSGDGILDRLIGEFPIDDLNAVGSTPIQLVQVSVLTRTIDPDPNLNTPGRPGVANRAASGVPDAFRRRLITVSASPRNLL